MNKPLISVIVPVYKAENYFDHCINSIRNQTYKNLEIILVDDGSPDRSGEMCDKVALEDKRIKVIHKENGGQSTARNAGLGIASGDLIGFVDSDDWIDDKMFSELYALLSENNADIAACGIAMDFPNGDVRYLNTDYPSVNKTEIYDGEEVFREAAKNQKITASVTDKLFKKEVIGDIRFKEGIIYEDFDLMPSWAEKCSRFVYTPIPYYHYIMTESSTIRGEFHKRHLTEADVSRRVLAFYKEKHPTLYSNYLARHIEILMNIVYFSADSKGLKKERKEIIKEIYKKSTFGAFKLLSGKNKLKLCVFMLSPSLFVKFMKLYNKK